MAEIQKIGESNVLLPAVVYMEILRGSADRKAQMIVESRMKRYSMLYINEPISTKAIELIELYHLSHGLKVPDALIAATALIHNQEFFTYNLKDFRYIPGIRLYQPV
ncbi:MAG: PIN domain-containing protein, partial [Bacteroidota bacterium]